MPKAERISKAKANRHDPLHVQIEEAGALPQRNRAAKKASKDDVDESVVPKSISKKILKAAQEQAQDEETAFTADFDDMASIASLDFDVENDSDDEVPDDEGFVYTGVIDEAEEAAMAQFLPTGAKSQGPSLADIILQKIAEKEAGEQQRQEVTAGIAPKVVQVYTQIGKWLKYYKSGKMPKAFKIIPNLQNWEQVLYLTHPLEWSPNAMREATKIFASNLNPKMAQRFYNLVLLPAVRENIANYKRLNFHYYMALKKALFKPAAWFKGILLPLAEENCTLREALIVSSVLKKVSCPVMHASAALIKLCQMRPWYGTTSVFIQTLIGKKYALPVRVVNESVEHFTAFLDDSRELPLVWYRALLTLVQRYKYDVTDSQKGSLKELMKLHHHDINFEIRRELFQAPPKELRAAAEATGMSLD